MESTYINLYVQPWITNGVMAIGPQINLRFDQEARNYIAGGLYCNRTDGTPNPAITFTPTMIERHGCFAACRIDTNDGFVTSWKSLHANKGILPDESMNGATVAALKTRMAAVRSQLKTVIDNKGIPAAATETLRAANWLQGIDLSANHPGFEVVRQSYVSALTDPPTAADPLHGQHHWCLKPPIYDPMAQLRVPYVASVMADMLAEIEANPKTAPVRAMHYVMEYGAASLILDTPADP